MDITHRTLKFYLYLAAVVTLGIAISLLRPQPVLSDSDLMAAVNSAFLPRTEDPALHDIAHQRALEASVIFSHTGQRTDAEVLAWNSGTGDPITTVISQWLGSPAHAAILFDPSFDRIGCAAVTTSDGRFVAACVLSRVAPVQSIVPAPPAEVPYSPPPTVSPPVVNLPNTATETP